MIRIKRIAVKKTLSRYEEISLIVTDYTAVHGTFQTDAKFETGFAAATFIALPRSTSLFWSYYLGIETRRLL